MSDLAMKKNSELCLKDLLKIPKYNTVTYYAYRINSLELKCGILDQTS